MRALKTILIVLLLSAALFAAGAALFWQVLLTPQQKLHYKLYFAANRDYADRAAAHPQAAAALSDYAGTLAACGNFGRAQYLCGLYGADSTLTQQWLALLARARAASANGQVYDYLGDPVAAQLSDLPAAQALRFLQGYAYAESGDWASAKNHFAAVERKQLAPPLRPYLDYYLARSYRLAGSAEERAQIDKLLTPLAAQQDDLALADKARYNLVVWLLTADHGQVAPPQLDRATALTATWWKQDVCWPYQKTRTFMGKYFLEQGDVRQAWPYAAGALGLGIDEPSAKEAGELCAAVLEAALASTDPKVLDGKGAIILDLPAGTLLQLAQCAAKHGFTKTLRALYPRLKDHLADRARWEELRAGLAICYRADKDAKALAALMADANLRNLSDAALCRIYFEYASLLEERRQWNDALSYYKSAAKLSGVCSANAAYRCYAILKQVSEPLNLDNATTYLRQTIADPDSDSMPKAVEELLPILIYRGDTAAAVKLCDWTLKQARASTADEMLSTERRRELDQLEELAHYWQAWLADKRGATTEAAAQRAAVPCRYFSYYELACNNPPQPELPADSTVLGTPESAGEYLAGLGLATLAEEYYGARRNASRALLQYCELAQAEPVAPVYQQQYAATQLLESGTIGERALLDYVLSQAYPQPYSAEVKQAAARHGIRAALIYAVMKKESNFREDAVSWVGAEGLMQLMPDTVRWLIGSGAVSADFAARKKPAVNIELGAAYLAHLTSQLGSETRAVLHSYNGGTGNYQKWSAQYSGAGPALLTDLVPNEENESFCKNVWKYLQLYTWLEKP